MQHISGYLRDRLWMILLMVLLTAPFSDPPIAQLLTIGVATACACKVIALVEWPSHEEQ